MTDQDAQKLDGEMDRRAAAIDAEERQEALGLAAPRVGVSIEQKVYLGNYETVSASIHLHGLTVGTSDEEIEELLNTGRIAYDAMRARIAVQVREIRERGGAHYE